MKISNELRVTSHKMLIQVLPSNMLAQPYTAQPQFYPGEILINGTCVSPPLGVSLKHLSRCRVCEFGSIWMAEGAPPTALLWYPPDCPP